jgi:sensor histidine kinase YesM
VDSEIEPEEILIPPMMLQPFAENAIWHGLIPKQGEKKLRIKFQLDKPDVLTCLVEDNGIGRAAAQKVKEQKQVNTNLNKSKGMSLVYNRLAILEKKYGTGFTVKVTDKMDDNGNASGTLVELQIPVTD